jgi:hypothetical protein
MQYSIFILSAKIQIVFFLNLYWYLFDKYSIIHAFIFLNNCIFYFCTF